MREIKFRWKTASGNWVCGNLSIFNNAIYDIISAGAYRSNSAGVPLPYYVDPRTVGQFTGLHDKNGNEIYEGDIVRYIGNCCGDYSDSEVKWDGAGFSSIAFMWKCGAISDTEETDLDLCVIGNIHDNKELTTYKK